MISVFDRLFHRALYSRTAPRTPPSLKAMQRVRSALLQCVEDCEGGQVARLRLQVEKARTAQELWLLRNDAYQVVSQHHNQCVAAERINKLLPLFNGLVAPSQLSKIR